MKIDREELREIIAVVLEMDPEDIGMDTEMYRELAINSLQILDMIGEIEDHYNITIDQSAVRNFTTINKIVEALEGMM